MSRASVTALFGLSSFEQAYYALRTRGSTKNPVFSAVQGGVIPVVTNFINLSSSGMNVVKDVGPNTVTFNVLTCPNWTVGKTGKPLYQESPANRISQQVALSSQFLAHFQFVISQNTALTGSEIVTTPNGSFGGTNDSYYGLLLLDGRVFCGPAGNLNARIYDPIKNVLTTANGSFLNTPGNYEGVTLLADGRVFCAPSGISTTARIYDPAKDIVTTPGGTYPNSVSVGADAFEGSTLLPDGRVFMVPSTCPFAMIYDPVTNSVSTPSGTYPGNSAHYGATMMLDGRVFCAPSTSPVARIYDPFNNVTTTPSGTYYGASGMNTAYKYTSAILLPDGRVFVSPDYASVAIIYDPVSNTISTPNGTYDTTGINGSLGARLMPDGRILHLPYGQPATNVLARIYDPVANVVTTPNNMTFSGFGALSNSVAMMDGGMYVVPHFTTLGARILRTYINTNFSPAALTGPYLNKY